MSRLLMQLCPALRAAGVTEVSGPFLAARGIAALILDLDNTLAPWHAWDAPPATEEWISRMHEAGVRLCIVSNTHRHDRLDAMAGRLGIRWVPSGGKPLRRGFYRAMAAMESSPPDTAVIGDQLLTDIWGGNRCGLLTILVPPMTPVEFWGTKVIHRSLERLIEREWKRRGVSIPWIGDLPEQA